MNNKKTQCLVLLLFSSIAIFYFATIRQGHDWGGDFSMYIHHAKNLSEGRDYADTGYLVNPDSFMLGPPTYPPVFPLLLVPIWKSLGFHLKAMKILVIFFFLLSLFIIWFSFKKKVSFGAAGLLTAILGFNPYFWEKKDSVTSDIPFLFFCYVALYLIDKLNAAFPSRKNWPLYSVAIGFTMYLAYGTRSIGLLLVPSVFLFDILKNRRISKSSVLSALVFGLFLIFQNLYFHSDTNYFLVLKHFSVRSVMHNLIFYLSLPLALWNNGYSMFISKILFVALNIICIIGVVTSAKKQIDIHLIFMIVYLSFIVFWPTEGTLRYLIPVIPLYMLYILFGIESLNRLPFGKLGYAISVIFLTAIFLSYVGRYTQMEYGRFMSGIAKPETIEFFDFVKQNTRENDVLIFRKPRVLALCTGRRASVYHQPYDPVLLWHYFRRINATYIVAGPFHSDNAFLVPFLSNYGKYVKEVFSNGDFVVYRIQDFSMIGSQ
jgi:hypothetical protein